jgi:glycosyltransferase involved in cell wall biosynthesis
MPKVSIILPARNERFLQRTIDNIFQQARGEIEVIPVLDAYWPDPPLTERPNQKIIHLEQVGGLRGADNAGAAAATGQFLMKADAHCAFAEGFDLALAAECDTDWIVVPRRYSLDGITWGFLNPGKAPVDYHYLSCPIWSLRERDDYSMHGVEWRRRTYERFDKPEYALDEQMSFQGSCWFTTKRFFDEVLGPLDPTGYGTFAQEPQEIGNKAWLSGGRIMVNKKTWYAHLHKGRQWGRGYHQDPKEIVRGHEYAAVYWMNNRWEKRAHDLEWLIDRFWPVPDWPEDWKAIHASGYGPHSVPEKAAATRASFKFTGQG